MPEIKANLSDEQLAILLDLAEKRGVDANTVLQQAIGTEHLISQNVGDKDELIVKKQDNSVAKFEFKSFAR